MLYGRDLLSFRRNRESRSREAAGRRNWPEAVPRKNERQKKSGLLSWKDRRGMSRGRWAARAEHKRAVVVCRRSGSTMALDSSGRSDGERGMAGANALGQRRSNVWPTICSRLSKPRTEMPLP